MEENNSKPIDFTKIIKSLWPHRKKYLCLLPATLIITYLILACIPRYYSCKVSLAPETSGTSITGSLGSLATSFGLGSSLAKMNSQDAIYSEIYPDVIKSKNFIAELMTVKVRMEEGGEEYTYYNYLRSKQKVPLWSSIMSAITELFSSKPEQSNYDGKEKLSVFNLNKQQEGLFSAVQGKIKCSVDKKTEIVTISVDDQCPLVCATMADSTCQKLQEFITTYRTNKARIDFEYYDRLYQESKIEYEKALKEYAIFSDAHNNTILASYRMKAEQLENEVQTKHSIYTAINTQRQAAAAKLQEATPAFTVIESASVPIYPAGPKRLMGALVVTILAFFALTGWLMLKMK